VELGSVGGSPFVHKPLDQRERDPRYTMPRSGGHDSNRGFPPFPLGPSKGQWHGRRRTVDAYILVQTEVGKAAQVAREVAGIKGVVSAEDVTGPYDVIVRAEARTLDDLSRQVLIKIQQVEGITRTITCSVVHL